MSLASRASASAILVALTLIGADAQAAAPCTDDNLLDKRPASRWTDIKNAARATDGVASRAGDPWDSDLATVLVVGSSQMTWDLRRVTTVDALWMQGDNNDEYVFSISKDGRNFTPIWTAPKVGGQGMRERHVTGLNAEGRYLRLSDMQGDGSYSVDEVQAYCKAPATWPPKVQRKEGRRKSKDQKRKTKLAYSKIALAMLGLTLFCFLFFRERPGVTFWTRWGPFYGAMGILLYGAASAWALPGAAGVLVLAAGGTWWLRQGERLEAHATRLQLGGLLACAAISAYVWVTRGGVMGQPLANLTGGMAIVIAAMRLADKPWARPMPLVAGLLAAGFAAFMTYGWLAVGAVAGVALVYSGVVWWRHRAADLEADRAWRWIERLALLLLIAAAGHTWPNFGDFHGGGRAVHMHDSFHYYMGSKYFAENGYTHLYHCAAVAESDEGRKRKVETRKIRDLENNLLVPADAILARAEECKARFTPERWVAFQQDLRLFRSYFGTKYWERLFHDHGYNATPVWTMVGHTLSNQDWEGWAEGIPVGGPGEATSARRAFYKTKAKQFREDRSFFEDRVQYLAAIDAGLYALIFLMIGWAFGLRAMALTMCVWAAGYPWAYFWTGGSFGRVPWLFMATAGVCLLKKRHSFLGGFALMWSLLLRVFPGALFAGVGLKVLHGLWKKRTISVPHRWLIAGAVTAGAVLVPASLPISGGIESYPAFVGNSLKHKQTPLTNNMGLPTLVGYDPGLVAKKMRNDDLDDPFAAWKQARLDTKDSRKLLSIALVIGIFALLFFATREEEDWVATALSTVAIFAIFELTCYYYNFMILVVPLALRRTRWMVAILAMAGVSQILQLRIGWFDEQYTAESFLIGSVLIFFLVDMIVTRRKEAAEDEISEEPGAPLASTEGT